YLSFHRPPITTLFPYTTLFRSIHYRDLCDVEFTVERGRLWILQTRIGKRGAVAAVRAAVEMVDDPDIALSPEEAVARVPASSGLDRKRTRLNSSHVAISYAVFC